MTHADEHAMLHAVNQAHPAERPQMRHSGHDWGGAYCKRCGDSYAMFLFVPTDCPEGDPHDLKQPENHATKPNRHGPD